MPSTADLGKAAASTDPETGLRAASALRRLAEQLELAQVRRARAAGWSWRDIALALNLSKQAVHHKYAHQIDEEAP